jgi:DNA polymerase-3 subunit delta
VERAERLLQELPETTDLILAEPKLDKRSSYYKLIKKATDFREFGELDEGGLTRWLSATAKDKGGSVSAADARLLIERVGTSQQILASELEKLLLYSSEVTRQSIELLTDKTPQGTIFELLEVAFSGHTRRALELYREQREQKVDPSQIIAMIAWQLRVLALIKTAGARSRADIASAARLNPYVVGKSQTVAARLSLAQLKRLIAELLAIDVRSKRQNIDLDEALQNYLLQLAS